MRIENGIAFVENPLLCAAIWGDTNCIYNGKPKFTGYLNANADRIGRAFIEYCIARVMKIFRLPMCGYDSYSGGGSLVCIMSLMKKWCRMHVMSCLL